MKEMDIDRFIYVPADLFKWLSYPYRYLAPLAPPTRPATVAATFFGTDVAKRFKLRFRLTFISLRYTYVVPVQ